MSKSNYWERRIQQQTDLLFDKTLLDTEKELKKKYKQALEDTLADIKDLWDKLQKESADGVIRPNDLYRYNRYFQVKNKLNERLKRLGLSEDKIYRRKFMNTYFDTQDMLSEYVAQLTKQPQMKSTNSFTMEQQNAAEKVLESIWCSDGKHWSDRIWSNKNKLQDRIEKGLMDCISRGVSKDELVKTLMDDFGKGFSDADRIARTELTYVQNQAAKDRYEAAGIKKYQYLAEIDSRTSDICKELNGKEFNFTVSSVGVNMPPMHTNCRSTIIPVVE